MTLKDCPLTRQSPIHGQRDVCAAHRLQIASNVLIIHNYMGKAVFELNMCFVRPKICSNMMQVITKLLWLKSNWHELCNIVASTCSYADTGAEEHIKREILIISWLIIWFVGDIFQLLSILMLTSEQVTLLSVAISECQVRQMSLQRHFYRAYCLHFNSIGQNSNIMLKH